METLWTVLTRVWYYVYKGWWKYRKSHINYTDVVIPWTIIKNNLSLKDYKKQFKDIHGHFKYQFLLPIVWIGHWIARRCIMHKKDIADEEQNKIIRAWIDTVDVSVREWCLHFRHMDEQVANDSYLYEPSVEAVRKMNDLLVAVYMQDGAYRVLFDMLAINWAVKVGEIYPGKIDHFLYTAKTIDDIDFKIIRGKFQDNLVFNLGDHKLVVKKGDAIYVSNVDMKTEKEKVRLELEKKDEGKA